MQLQSAKTQGRQWAGNSLLEPQCCRSDRTRIHTGFQRGVQASPCHRQRNSNSNPLLLLRPVACSKRMLRDGFTKNLPTITRTLPRTGLQQSGESPGC
jgi:hypothetical protein